MSRQYELIKQFEHGEMIRDVPRYPDLPRQVIRYQPKIACDFVLYGSDRCFISKYMHFVGKDWIASFYFMYRSEPQSEPIVTPLRIRGNKEAAEEALVRAFLLI